MDPTLEMLERLAGIESSIATGALLTSQSGFVNGQLVLLSNVENPQRVKKSTAETCQSCLIENPTHMPLLVALDGEATPVTAQFRVPPYRGRMLCQPHRTVSIGVDPALLGEEPPAGTQLIIYVAQYVRAYAPGVFSINASPGSIAIPNTIAGALNTVQPGPNVPAAAILVQSKISNAQPVFYGTSAQTAGNFGTDVGVLGELAPGASVVLGVNNLNLLTFGSSAAFVVYASAFR